VPAGALLMGNYGMGPICKDPLCKRIPGPTCKDPLCKPIPVEQMVEVIPVRDEDLKAKIQRNMKGGPTAAPAIEGDVCSLLPAESKINRRAPFFVEILREGPQWRHVGLTVAVDPDPNIPAVLIEEVLDPSLVSEWNHRYPTFAIRINDVIRGVNYKHGNAEAMVQELADARKGWPLKLHIA